MIRTPQTLALIIIYFIFSERERHVRYLLSPVRLSSVCLSSVMFVRPTQAVQIFGNNAMALGRKAIH